MIGYSTGSFYKLGIGLEERINAIKEVGSDCIELSFACPSDATNFNLTPGIIRKLQEFSNISLHAPWYQIRYENNSEVGDVVEKLREIAERVCSNGIVIHPDVIGDWNYIEESGMDWVIENMDSKKSFGKYPNEMEAIGKEHEFDFVLDLFHTYENRPDLEFVREMREAMKDRIRHVHLSGIGSERHCLVCSADNLDYIQEILKDVREPIILEGVLYERSMAKIELDFVNSLHLR